MAIRGLPQTIPELVSEATTFHREGRIAEAANLYMHILEREPNNLNALHLYGVLALQAGQVEQAIDHIERAVRVDASRAPIHFNLGNAYLQAGKVDDAIAAYRRALGIDNGMADAWTALGKALIRSDQYADAIASAGQALQLNPDDIAAHSCIAMARHSSGELEEALSSYKRALQINGDDPQLLNNIGFLYYEMADYEEAARFCRRATTLAPEYGPAYLNLGLSLTESGRLAVACKALGRAVELVRESATCHNTLGRALLLSGRHNEALSEFSEAIKLDPQMESAYNNRGLALQRLGRLEAASDAYEQALVIKPGYTDAWLNLAVLQEQANHLELAAATIARGQAEVPEEPGLLLMAARLRRRSGEPAAAGEVLETLLDADLPAELRRRVLFEQGRVANILEHEVQAFACFSEANVLARKSPAGVYFQHQDYTGQVLNLAAGMAGDWSKNWHSEQFTGEDDPVFLLGFPRSGTTLLEQVLTGHPQIVALEEQSLIAQVGRKLASVEGDYPALLGGVPNDQRRELREEYLELARQQAGWKPGQLLLDKFPLNTVHLPLIHCLFPQARLLLALRHPFDVALSCFMQDFELNEAMVNFTSLQDTAVLYDAVMSVCRESQKRLPLRMHEVRYENLVDDLEGQARLLLDFLDLEWRDEVMDFVSTAASKKRIQTPSHEQVSQPLYREARLRWQRYSAQLAPLDPLLRPHCERLGYDADGTGSGADTV